MQCDQYMGSFLWAHHGPTSPLGPLPEQALIGVRPNADRRLAATLHRCEVRQEWYRDYLAETQEDRLGFVGSVPLGARHGFAAGSIRALLGASGRSFHGPQRRASLVEAAVELAESAGILVMVGPVASDDPEDGPETDAVHGITLADGWAPAIFINEALAPAAQLRVLARHLALLWLGASAVTRPNRASAAGDVVARWCDGVADEAIDLLSALVTDRQLVLERPPDADFCARVAARASRRFAWSLINHTLEGQTTFTEAFRLLGINSTDAFNAIGRSLDIEI